MRVRLKEHERGTVVWASATLGERLSETKFVVHLMRDLDHKRGIIVDFAKALFEISPETRGLSCYPLPGVCGAHGAHGFDGPRRAACARSWARTDRVGVPGGHSDAAACRALSRPPRRVRSCCSRCGGRCGVAPQHREAVH